MLENDTSWLIFGIFPMIFNRRQPQRLGLILSFSFHTPESMVHVQPALSAHFRVQPSPDLVRSITEPARLFSICISLSRSMRDQSSLSTGSSVCTGAVPPPRLSSRSSSAFWASTKRTCSAGPGSALGAWPKLFQPTTEPISLAPHFPAL
jgi:hypothetical protein